MLSLACTPCPPGCAIASAYPVALTRLPISSAYRAWQPGTALMALLSNAGCYDPGAVIAVAADQHAQCRYHHQQHHRADQHAADDDGRQRPLHLTADPVRQGRR